MVSKLINFSHLRSMIIAPFYDSCFCFSTSNRGVIGNSRTGESKYFARNDSFLHWMLQICYGVFFNVLRLSLLQARNVVSDSKQFFYARVSLKRKSTEYIATNYCRLFIGKIFISVQWKQVEYLQSTSLWWWWR